MPQPLPPWNFTTKQATRWRRRAYILMKASIPFFSTSILLKENSKIQSCFGLKIFKLTKPLPPWLFKGVQPSYLVRTTCSLLPIPPTPKINIWHDKNDQSRMLSKKCKHLIAVKLICSHRWISQGLPGNKYTNFYTEQETVHLHRISIT